MQVPFAVGAAVRAPFPSRVRPPFEGIRREYPATLVQSNYSDGSFSGMSEADPTYCQAYSVESVGVIYRGDIFATVAALAQPASLRAAYLRLRVQGMDGLPITSFSVRAHEVASPVDPTTYSPPPLAGAMTTATTTVNSPAVGTFYNVDVKAVLLELFAVGGYSFPARVNLRIGISNVAADTDESYLLSVFSHGAANVTFRPTLVLVY